jgi:mRNA interferase MazF
MRRGEIWWASLPAPAGSGPGFRRPVLVVQANPFNESRIQTVIVAVLTSNMALAVAPGNVSLTPRQSSLPRASVVNVSQVMTLDRALLTECVGRLSPAKLGDVDAGLRLVLAL